MICPLCGDKLRVVDSRFVEADNITIRRRRCVNKDCMGIFYTREVEVPFEDVNEDLNKLQNKYRAKRRTK